MTYNTGNPVPSFDPRDLDDNAQAFDRFLQNATPSEPDRLGAARKTWWQMEQDAAALVSPNVSALAAVTAAVDKAVFFNAVSPVGMGTYTLTSFSRSLGAAVDAPAFRTAVGAAASGANTDITSITGSAASLTTSHSLSATGDATWTVSFNGTANVTAALTLATTGVAAGSYSEVTVDTKGRVTAGVANPSFTNFSLQNSWVVISGRRAAYRKISDMVQIDFQASGGTATNGTLLATLPAGSRPPFPMAVPVVSGPNTTPSTTVAVPRVIIDTDGTITCQNCSSVPGVGFAVTFSTI